MAQLSPFQEDDRGGWKTEARDLSAALAGGAIIGVPLLYTMEMWWHGASLSPQHLLVLLGCILALNFGFDLISGFRDKYSPFDALGESITSVAIGLLFSALVLSINGQWNQPQSWESKLGQTLVTALVVSLGASFANSQVRRKSRVSDDDDGEDDEKPKREQWRVYLQDLGATVAGSVVFAINVAPTEEILLIAMRTTPWQQLGLLACGLGLCYIILFASGLDEKSNSADTIGQKPWAETLFASATSWVVAAGLLLLLGQSGTVASPQIFIASVLSLGLPAIVGGAAGRLIA